jgi:preprotein translocase subunit SecD
MPRYFLALALSAAIQPACHAADMTLLTIHRECSGEEATSDQLLLRYLSPAAAQGNPDPVCVLRKPELADLPIHSARVEPSPGGVGARAVIELDESAKPLIEQMTRNNKGKNVAFVVDHRVVSLAMITRAYSDNRILVNTLTRADAERVVLAVSPEKHRKTR